MDIWPDLNYKGSKLGKGVIGNERRLVVSSRGVRFDGFGLPRGHHKDPMVGRWDRNSIRRILWQRRTLTEG